MRRKTYRPFFTTTIRAGEASQVDNEYADDMLDMNEFLIRHPDATYYLRVVGDSMIEHRIYSGDVVVVDRSLEAHEGSIAIVNVDGNFTVKEISRVGGALWLVPANSDFQAVCIHKDQTCDVWGVVTAVVHRFT